MLGISATPTRQDGLMKVLKYYIGDIFFVIKSNEKNTVKVERYLLSSNNENYNKEVLNFKNKPQMANMINNIADYHLRTKLIIDKVVNEIKMNDKRQILILSDRRQQLEDMYKIITEISDISCGYYIGGLKKNVLKENEKCRVLLGTYPMASTGLDIPSLNGLVLATPRSDIIQSIGRIDRIIHIDIQPLIIDICDQFSLFENQCRKRFAVFKKKKYMIEDISYDIDKNIILKRNTHLYHECNTLKKKSNKLLSEDNISNDNISEDNISEDNISDDNISENNKSKKSINATLKKCLFI
jgi:superfamily II DNA or RNA helicase